jgi:hypothetical protein
MSISQYHGCSIAAINQCFRPDKKDSRLVSNSCEFYRNLAPHQNIGAVSEIFAVVAGRSPCELAELNGELILIGEANLLGNR